MKYADYMMAMQQDDGSLGPTELVAAYEQGIEGLRSAVAGMSPEQLLARPIVGKWSTLEVVSHITDTEVYFTDRIERTIALERPLLMGVDERPYAERLHYQAFDLDEQLDLFTALRRHPSASCACNRRKPGNERQFTAKPAWSLSANWCSRLCDTFVTICGS